jgi:hypothetical protein
MRLSGSEFKQWVEAFEDAFNERAELDQVVLIATSQTLEHFVSDAGLVDQIPALIRKTDDGGLLDRLLTEALKRRPENQLLNALKVERDTQAMIEPTQPLEAWRVWGEPMFDRDIFRNSLGQLQTGGAPPVLLVHGERFSGKSWSIRLVNYLMQSLEGVTHLVVDLEVSAAGKAVDAALLGRLIAEKAAFKDPPAPTEEQDARWIQDYCDWLGREAKRAGGSWWIIVDHLEKVVVVDSAKDLLYAIGKEIPRTMPTVRLIVLNNEDPAALASAIGTMILNDPIPSMPLDEIRTCLAKFFAATYLARARGGSQSADSTDLQKAIAQSTDTVLGEIDATDPRRLVKMGEAIRRELARQ